MIEVINNLNNIKYPNAYAGIQLLGFFGSFVKNIINKNINVSTINKSSNLYRQDYFLNNQEKLKKIRLDSDVKMKDVFELINSTHIEINSVDIKYKYKFSPSNKLSAQKNHIVHTAVINYNLTALKKILNMGADPCIVNTHKRNILHLAEIVDATEIKSFLLSLPINALNKLRSAKDVFGRTPDDIYKLKSNNLMSKTAVSDVVDSGGWDDSEAEKWNVNRCDIEVVNYDQIDSSALIKNYISIQKPVLIKNAIYKYPQLREKFKKQNFELHFGKTLVSTGEIPYSSTYKKPEKRGEFNMLRRGINEYVFCGLDKDRDRKLISEFSRFEIIKKLHNDNWQFYAGPKETGAPLHNHTNAWNLLIYGKKRWIINTPLKGVYSKEHIRKWLKNNNDNYKEFVQEAGDLVYIPRYWAHGVINLKESIGVATEFTSPYIY